jgi:sec-independent protein translocase protein TatC
MTLLEHLQELRSRLFKASLAIAAGAVAGWLVNGWVMTAIERPYCDLIAKHVIHSSATTGGPHCAFIILGPTDYFVLRMQVALWVGLVLAGPLWLYQLWAFVAPGLHRHERRWAYTFAAIAAPLFALGGYLAYRVVPRALQFLLGFNGANVLPQLEVTKYFDFVTGLMLVFGVAFEFPLVAVLLNVTGLVSARKLLSWWRVVTFVFFVFAAVTVPTPDPFIMSGLGLFLAAMYFAAVGIAFLNDRRRRRRSDRYGAVGDDEISPLDVAGDLDRSPPSPANAWEPLSQAAARPAERRFDDLT